MKKLLLFIALVLGISAVNAQLGIQAGATFYNYKSTFESVSVKSDTKVGFTIGVTSEWPLGSSINFAPALNFTQKGGVEKDDFEGSEEKFTATFNYLELPLNFVYHTAGTGGSFFVGAGPVLGWGLGGKSKSSTNSAEDEDIHFGNNDDDDLKAFELSANILAGYRFDNGFFVSANYNPGISDLSPEGSDGKFHNNGFAIRLGYMFAKMKPKSASSDTQ